MPSALYIQLCPGRSGHVSGIGVATTTRMIDNRRWTTDDQRLMLVNKDEYNGNNYQNFELSPPFKISDISSRGLRHTRRH